MGKEEKILKEIKDKEKALLLYRIEVFGVSLWRIVRFGVRLQKLAKTIGYTNKTKKDKVSFMSIMKYYFVSLLQVIRLIISGKKYDNVVFASPRLVFYNGKYLDKFTDPIINQTSLKNSALVIQRHLGTKHLRPRFSENNPVVLADFIDYTSKFCAILFFPLFYLLFCKQIDKIHHKAESFFDLNKRFLIVTSIKVADFYFQMKLWQFVFWRITPQRIFVVTRDIWFPCISACKRKQIKVYELQHGITHSETALYTGDYDTNLDPDYFLMFGEKWKGKQFGVPLDRLINIG